MERILSTNYITDKMAKNCPNILFFFQTNLDIFTESAPLGHVCSSVCRCVRGCAPLGAVFLGLSLALRSLDQFQASQCLFVCLYFLEWLNYDLDIMISTEIEVSETHPLST